MPASLQRFLHEYHRTIQALRTSAASISWRPTWLLTRQAPPTAYGAFDLDADRLLCALHAHSAERYQPDPWVYGLSAIQERLIAAPSIRDRCTSAVLDDIGPHYERGFIEHSYTGAKGRGPHRAVLRYQGWLRRYRYRLCLDIRRYFRPFIILLCVSYCFAPTDELRGVWYGFCAVRESSLPYRTAVQALDLNATR